MKSLKSNKGITLIALVITIIVLLILAGVSISAIAGENGIIQKAKDAAEKTENEAKEENDILQGYEDYFSTIDGTSGEKRNITVTTTQTEGEDLWNNIVTLNISVGETTLTQEQKEKLAAYMLDYSNYEEFKLGVEDLSGVSYETFISGLGCSSETEFLNFFTTIMSGTLNYEDIDEIESLGLPVITVTTPYGTKLYTNSLGGMVQCGLVENGTYTFTIQSGSTTVTETVEINNIREYSTEAPYDVKIECPGYYSGYLSCAIDDSTEFVSMANETTLSVNNSISLKNAEPSTYITSYVEKDEEFFKYFIDEGDWEAWNTPWNNLFYFLMYISNKINTGVMTQEKLQDITARQVLFLMAVEAPEFASDVLKYVDEEMLNLWDDSILEIMAYWDGESSSDAFGELLEKYPSANVGFNSFKEPDEIKSITFTKDTNIYFDLQD